MSKSEINVESELTDLYINRSDQDTNHKHNDKNNSDKMVDGQISGSDQGQGHDGSRRITGMTSVMREATENDAEDTKPYRGGSSADDQESSCKDGDKVKSIYPQTDKGKCEETDSRAADSLKLAEDNGADNEKHFVESTDLEDTTDHIIDDLKMLKITKEGDAGSVPDDRDDVDGSVCVVSVETPSEVKGSSDGDELTDRMRRLCVSAGDDVIRQVRSHTPTYGVPVTRPSASLTHMQNTPFSNSMNCQNRSFVCDKKRSRDQYEDTPAAIYRRPNQSHTVTTTQSQICVASTVKMSGGMMKINSPTTDFNESEFLETFEMLQQNPVQCQLASRQPREFGRRAVEVAQRSVMSGQQGQVPRRRHLDSEGYSQTSSPMSNYDTSSNHDAMSPMSDYSSIASPNAPSDYSNLSSPTHRDLIQNDLSNTSYSPRSNMYEDNIVFNEVPEQKILNTDRYQQTHLYKTSNHGNLQADRAYAPQMTSQNCSLQQSRFSGAALLQNSSTVMDPSQLSMQSQKEKLIFDEVLKSLQNSGQSVLRKSYPVEIASQFQGVSANVDKQTQNVSSVQVNGSEVYRRVNEQKTGLSKGSAPEFEFTAEQLEEIQFLESALLEKNRNTNIQTETQSPHLSSKPNTKATPQNSAVMQPAGEMPRTSASLMSCTTMPSASQQVPIATSVPTVTGAVAPVTSSSNPPSIINILVIPPVNSTPPCPSKKTTPRRPVPIAPKPMPISDQNRKQLSDSVPKSSVGGTKSIIPREHQEDASQYSCQKAGNEEPIEQHPSFIKASRFVANVPRDELVNEDSSGDNCLHIAVCREDKYMMLAILARLMRQNLTALMVDKTNDDNQTPLYLAAVSNQPVIVQKLIECGADVNIQARDPQKRFKGAIHYAAAHGKKWLPILHALLEAKNLDISKPNSEGLTALHCAVLSHGSDVDGEMSDCWPIVHLLLKRGASLAETDHKNGKSVLHHIIEKKDLNVIRKVLNLDLPNMRSVVNCKDYNGNTCLHTAAGLPPMKNTEDQMEIIKLLMDKGADPNISNNEHNIPKKLCSGNTKLVDVLSGRTPKSSSQANQHHTQPQTGVPIQNIPVAIVTTQGIPLSVPSPMAAPMPPYSASSPRGSSTYIADQPIVIPTQYAQGVTMTTHLNGAIKPVISQKQTAVFSNSQNRPQMAATMPTGVYLNMPGIQTLAYK